MLMFSHGLGYAPEAPIGYGPLPPTYTGPVPNSLTQNTPVAQSVNVNRQVVSVQPTAMSVPSPALRVNTQGTVVKAPSVVPIQTQALNTPSPTITPSVPSVVTKQQAPIIAIQAASTQMPSGAFRAPINTVVTAPVSTTASNPSQTGQTSPSQAMTVDQARQILAGGTADAATIQQANQIYYAWYNSQANVAGNTSPQSNSQTSIGTKSTGTSSVVNASSPTGANQVSPGINQGALQVNNNGPAQESTMYADQAGLVKQAIQVAAGMGIKLTCGTGPISAFPPSPGMPVPTASLCTVPGSSTQFDAGLIVGSPSVFQTEVQKYLQNGSQVNPAQQATSPVSVSNGATTGSVSSTSGNASVGGTAVGNGVSPTQVIPPSTGNNVTSPSSVTNVANGNGTQQTVQGAGPGTEYYSYNEGPVSTATTSVETFISQHPYEALGIAAAILFGVYEMAKGGSRGRR